MPGDDVECLGLLEVIHWGSECLAGTAPPRSGPMGRGSPCQAIPHQPSARSRSADSAATRQSMVLGSVPENSVWALWPLEADA